MHILNIKDTCCKAKSLLKMNDRKMKILECTLLCQCNIERKNRERKETMRKLSRFGYNTIEMPYGASQSEIAFLTLSFILDYQPFKLDVWGLKRPQSLQGMSLLSKPIRMWSSASFGGIFWHENSFEVFQNFSKTTTWSVIACCFKISSQTFIFFYSLIHCHSF